MELTKAEEDKLLEWGVKFFDLGYGACIMDFQKISKWGRISKSRKVREFIKEHKDDKFE